VSTKEGTVFPVYFVVETRVFEDVLMDLETNHKSEAQFQ